MKKRNALAMTFVILVSMIMMFPSTSAELWLKYDMGKAQDGNVYYGLYSMSVGDGDRDGMNEVYVTSRDDGHVYQYKYVSAGKWKITDIGSSGFYADGVTVGDGDGDGKMDVYSGGADRYWFWRYTAYMYQFVHKPDGSWKRTKMGAAGWWISDVAIGDGDNDGRTDVFVSDYDGHIYMYVYTNTWNRYDVGSAGRYMRAVAVGDGDNDGKNEVYAANSNGHIYEFYYENGLWHRVDLGGFGGGTNNYYGMYDVEVGDADNDGNNEVYGAHYSNGRIYQFNYDKNTDDWTVKKIAELGTNIRIYGMAIGDGDTDGKNEIYAGASNKIIYRIKHSNDTWGHSSVGSTNGAVWDVDVGTATKDKKQKEVYGASQDGHAYQFFIDRVPPPNPIVWSTTHKVNVWSNISIVEVMWKDGGRDASGIDGYSYEWSTSPDTIPDKVKDCEESVHNATSPVFLDGIYYFHIRAVDRSLNWNPGATHFGPLKIDRRPPHSLKIIINDNAEYTNNKIVKLKIDAYDDYGNLPYSGIGYFALSNDGKKWSSWMNWTEDVDSWDLTDASAGGNDKDGLKRVYLKVRDIAGNIADETANDTIFLDRKKPVALRIKINDDAPYTTSSQVTLSVHATDPAPGSGMSKMQFSNDGKTWSSWEDFSRIRKNWDLVKDAGGMDEDGEKIVYLRVKDKAGNIAGPVSDVIILDRKKPENLNIIIENGKKYTNDSVVDLTIEANDTLPGSGIYQMAISNNNKNYTWMNFSNSYENWSLISEAGGVDSDGIKKVYLMVNDHAGNIAGPVYDDIFLDRKKPVDLKIIINDGAEYTTSSDVKLKLSATDPSPASGVSEMCFSPDGNAWTSWEPFATEKNYTLPSGDGKKRVYFKVKDKAGNVADFSWDDIILDTTSPSIYNVIVVGVTDTSAIISWQTNEYAIGGIEYGTTREYGSRIDESLYAKSHTLTIKSLKPATTYHFRVFAKDEAGNGPVYSSDYVFITKEEPDISPPVITNVRAEGISDKSVVIYWETNEPADSVVEYGIDKFYGKIIEEKNLVIRHSIVLKDLTPDTTYHFRVKSTDAYGNGPSISEDYQFTTLSTPDTTPPTIISVKVYGITDEMAIIVWDTDEPANSVVRYGKTNNYTNTVEDNTYLKHHEIVLTDLEPNTTYHFRVESTDAHGNGPAMSGDMQFKTNALPDTTPPKIWDVKVLSVTDTTCIIFWRTDEPSTSVVEYGLNTSYGMSSIRRDYVITHQITIGNLTPGTLYHFRVKSADASGNGPTVSRDYTFRTEKEPIAPDKTPPIILKVEVSGIANDRAVIIWETDELSDSFVEYGLNVNYGNKLYEESLVKVHSILITGLEPATTYHFRVKSTDAYGNGPTVSKDYTFTTTSTPDVNPPIILDVEIVDVTNNTAMINWSTDEPSIGILEYGTTTSYGMSINTTGYFKNHTVVIKGLKPGTSYHFRIKAIDSSGNGPSASPDYEFTTKKTDMKTPDDRKPQVPFTTGTAEFSWWLLLLLLGVIVSCIVAYIGYTRYRKRMIEGKTETDALKPDDEEDETSFEVLDEEDDEGIDEEESSSEAEPEKRELEEIPEPEPLSDIPVSVQEETKEIDEEKVDEKKPIKYVRCSGCKGKVPVYSLNGPQKITCPSCGRSGTYKPKKRSEFEEKKIVRKIRCSGCKSIIPLYTTEYPTTVVCPMCNRRGIYKGPKKE